MQHWPTMTIKFRQHRIIQHYDQRKWRDIDFCGPQPCGTHDSLNDFKSIRVDINRQIDIHPVPKKRIKKEPGKYSNIDTVAYKWLMFINESTLDGRNCWERQGLWAQKYLDIGWSLALFGVDIQTGLVMMSKMLFGLGTTSNSCDSIHEAMQVSEGTHCVRKCTKRY